MPRVLSSEADRRPQGTHSRRYRLKPLPTSRAPGGPTSRTSTFCNNLLPTSRAGEGLVRRLLPTDQNAQGGTARRVRPRSGTDPLSLGLPWSWRPLVVNGGGSGGIPPSGSGEEAVQVPVQVSKS